MGYRSWRNGFIFWVIGLIIFTFGGIWYIYRIITETNISNIVFGVVWLLLMIFNYSRIKRNWEEIKKMREEYYKEQKEKILENLKDETN